MKLGSWQVCKLYDVDEVLATAHFCGMKSAYEIAMERLEREQPSQPLTDAQREELAEIDKLYEAKVAEKEVKLRDQLAEMMANGDQMGAEQLQQQFYHDRKALEAEREERKENVRNFPDASAE
jgi:hypothetical protein